MPFDGASFVLLRHDVSQLRRDRLQSAMCASGLKPVDVAFLAWHKAEQIRRNPAGWAYRHQQVVALAQVAVLLASVSLFVALLSLHQVPSGFVCGVTMFALGSSVLFFPVKGPAEWRERRINDFSAVPPAIREAAERLESRLPSVGFVVGELFQEKVKLDPYLVAEYGNARVVLGIWDGDKVIACA